MESKCPYCGGKGYHEMPDGRPDNLCLLCGGTGFIKKEK